MSLVSAVLLSVINIILGVLATALVNAYKNRLKLKVFLTSTATFNFKNSPEQINTFNVFSCVVLNESKKNYEDVEINLQYKPLNYTFSPHVSHKEELLSDGICRIKIDKIKSKNYTILNIMYTGPSAPLVSVSSEDGISYPLITRPQAPIGVIPSLAGIGFMIVGLAVTASGIIFLGLRALKLI
ncbi:hypothetical protein [Oceanicaulis sp. MMSF_3324]|uniref:hypothetical protein n=1 Tax=Oceanicaulis sp. MMSF_3324 TaxID=3046702 RepID=UPI00273DEF4F|nr:hypothetical protein [Oceanicaulis sp. MMSF_3324]